MTWTRLEGTPIWNLAKAAYDRDPRRTYHNWQHVLRLYHHAEHTFHLPYDEQLDRAILAHDVIYDHLANKELRSADWLLANDPLATQDAHDHIMRTAGHSISTDNRIILLDLADFMEPSEIVGARTRLEKESIALYGINALTFAQANAEFLEKMARNYSPARTVELPLHEQSAFSRIQSGIFDSLQISKEFLTA